MNAEIPSFVLPITQFLKERLPKDFKGSIEIHHSMEGFSTINISGVHICVASLIDGTYMNAEIPYWVSPIVQSLKERLPKDFVGSIEINCFLGGISNVNIRQSYKPSQTQKELSHGEKRERRAVY